MPSDAPAGEHRERSDWWHAQAQAAWDLAHASRFDLPRWHQLMHFYRDARGAQLAERDLAEAMERPNDRAQAALPSVSPVAMVPVRVERPSAGPLPLRPQGVPTRI